MAEFYGRLQGSRGPATRCGTKSSGIWATAETWTSVLSVSQASDGACFSLTSKHGDRILTLPFDADAIVKVLRSDNEEHKKLVRHYLGVARSAMDCASDIATQIL